MAKGKAGKANRQKFADLLGTMVDEAKKPEPIPVGIYASKVKDFSFRDFQNNDGETINVLRVQHTNLSPIEIEDEEALENFKNLEKRVVHRDYFMTVDDLWRLAEFFDHAGIQHSGRTFDECLEEIVGVEVGIQITQRQSKKEGEEEVYYNDVSRTAPLA